MLESEIFYDENYIPVFMQAGNQQASIIEPTEKICRFCGKDSTQTTFKDIAHALPEMLGNKTLISASECDKCNSFFNRNLESHLDSYLGLLRTLSGVKGKNGIPVFDKGNLNVQFTANNMFQITVKDKNLLDMDKENKYLYVTIPKTTFIPIAIYKALVKMGLSVMPYEFTKLFNPTLKWLQEKHENSHPYFQNFAKKTVQTFIPGINPFQGINVLLMIRKDDNAVLPFCQFIVAFANFMFQISIPCPDKENHLSGQQVTFKIFPHPFDKTYTEELGEIKAKHVDLSGVEKITLPQKIRLSYESLEDLNT